MAQVLGEDFKTAVRKRNLQRLRSLNVRTSDGGNIQGGIGDDTTVEKYMTEVKTWIAASESALDVAKSTQVFGRKDDLNWSNVVFTFLENAAISIRILERVVNAAQAARAGDDDLAMQELIGADAHITEIAQMMGLNYVTICDLPLEAPEGHWEIVGPFCGMFWSTDSNKPFIGIVFKGTNANNRGEVRVDFQRGLQQTKNGVLNNTHVSKGVSNALFSKYRSVQSTAFDYIHDTFLGNVPQFSNPYLVHVTGHSLGASYATLFHSEFLHQINSAKPDPRFLLGDLYAFGSPRIGGDDFASMVKSTVGRHMGSTWRIVCEGDPITMMPPAPGGHPLFPKPDPPVFFHIDSGVVISRSMEPERLESEVGLPGVPHPDMTWDEIDAAMSSKHMPRAYWLAIVKAANIPWEPTI